jgi:branched-chain amino acid transport system substrate-binding protein
MGSQKYGGAFAGFSTCGRSVTEAAAATHFHPTPPKRHKTKETHMHPSLTSQRRRTLLLAAGASLAAPLASHAQAKEDIVLGGSIPMTGVFAFAGVGINAGMADYVKLINDAGGIKGRKLRYVPEDTAYKVDVSVAAFKKITSQNKVNLYYGDSTGFAKTINPEIDRLGSILMAGASFATELNNPEKYPNQFLVGPDYTEMFGILLKHIAKEKPGAKVAFVYSDSEFGRDPIDASEAAAKKLGLNVVAKLMTPAGSVDVSTEIIKLRRAAPDYTIFHGYVLAPIPEFVQQGKQMGMTSKWMGTFWTMDSSTVMKMGEAGDGFMGVMPYRYYYDTEKAPMLEKIRQLHPDYQSTAYIQGFLATMLFAESAKRCLDAGKELNGKNLKAALNSIKDFDTGGLIGVPITIKGNSIPVGRVYKADMKAQKMVAASDWIAL